MVKLYQLYATGEGQFLGDRRRVRSKRVFADVEAAEEYKEEFKRLATIPFDRYDLAALEDNHLLEMGIFELEIEQGELQKL